MIRIFALFLLLLAAPVNASSDWLEANTEHFVIYSDQKQSDVREFADRLERYHNAMTEVLRTPRNKPSPSNRVTIYVLRDQQQIRKLAQGSRFVAGFYIPRAGASAAFVSRVDTDTAKADFSEIILLHEYAHHVLISNSEETYPLWLNEGLAEFFGTAMFYKDGSVGLGLPALHRDKELAYAEEVPLTKLLDTKSYVGDRSSFYDRFYGRSWLLFHYLFFNVDRQGQLSKYLINVRAGKPEIEAARDAFGDLNKLDRELDNYLRRTRLDSRTVVADAVKPGPITIAPLSAGAAAMMPIRIVSKRGVDEKMAKELLPQAQAVAARYPADPFVQSALAEAEFDAGNDGAAIAAADRALAANPNDLNAMIQKGYAMARQAKAGAAAWADVRKQFVKVNKIEADHPIPLIQYHGSYVEEGVAAPKVALDGLFWAHRLAPFDQDVRWKIANEQYSSGQYKRALDTLAPLAHNPHKSEFSDKAKELIGKVEAELAKAEKPQIAADTGN